MGGLAINDLLVSGVLSFALDYEQYPSNYNEHVNPTNFEEVLDLDPPFSRAILKSYLLTSMGFDIRIAKPIGYVVFQYGDKILNSEIYDRYE